MNTFDLTLDLSKQVSMEPLRLRQGDKSGTTVRATVYDHGELVSGSYTARIAMRHPGSGDTYYRETGTFANGVATFTIDEQYAATVTGRTTGYVQLLQGSTVIASTADFPVVILRDATEGAVPGEVYDSAIEDALAELDEATGRISVMVQEQVAEELAAHPEWTTTVQDNSVTDAKLVQTGGILSRVDRLMYRLDNLLTGDTGEQEVAVVADAAATPVAGLSVYGRSVQDGTPTPSAPVAIESVEGNLLDVVRSGTRTDSGLTWTYNADGTVTVNGTATGNSWSHNSTTETAATLPAGDYTASVGAPFGLVVMVDGTQLYAGMNSSYTFTLAAESSVRVYARATSGTVYSGETTGIMLVRGSAALPFVPYGHAGLRVQGTNLARNANQSRTVNGVTFTINADGTITADGTATANAQFDLVARASANAYLLPDGAYALSGCPAGGGSSVYELTLITNPNSDRIIRDFGSGGTTSIADGSGMNGCGLYIMIRSGQTVSGLTFRPMLQRGSTATPYQPYVESVTPVPLGGHVLRSLPDGTRDEVTVDARGHAVLVQRVGEVTIDASEWQNRNTVAIGDGWYRVVNDLLGSAESVNYSTATQGMCTDAPFVYDASLKIEHVGTQNVYVLLVAQESTSAAIAAKYDGATVLYKLATPVTHDLGYVDPVALTSPDATMQAVTGIATTFRADYERDLNVTLARLEAAIATLA